MKGTTYERPNYPETWARMHGKGRVFYTSMGHREDVWENPMYQGLLSAPGLGDRQGRRRRRAEHQEGHAGLQDLAQREEVTRVSASVCFCHP